MRCERSPGAPAGKAEAGFTYLGLLILVAILALATSATVTLGSIAQRRQAEQRLLEVGAAYREAISSYLNSSPSGRRSYPVSLAELLKDPRYPGNRRHLRQLYADPISGKTEWGLVQAPDGGIMVVHSLSSAPVTKMAEFEPENLLFAVKSRYSEWVFMVDSVLLGTGAGGLRSSQGANVVAPMPASFSPQNQDRVAPQGGVLSESTRQQEGDRS